MELPTLPNLPALSQIPKRRIVIVAAVAVVAITVFFLVRANLRVEGPGATAQAELTLWGTFDDTEMQYLIGSYGAVQPGVRIIYRKIDAEDYERTLINALAAGQGPDMFMIHSHAVPRNLDKIVPAPSGEMNRLRLEELFPAVVAEDFADKSGSVYALPLYLDTMVMFYNKELLDQAFIVQPPATWEEFERNVPRLRAVNASGQIVRAAAAIGGSPKTIDNAVDLLNLLMLQNGAPMVDEDLTGAVFESPSGGSGLAAFNFYLKFANAGSSFYTWNDNQGNYLDSFVSGKTAMIFDYQRRVSAIRERAPFLRLGVAPMPQLGSGSPRVNYADYWGITVSRQSKYPAEAWGFIVGTTTNEQTMRSSIENYGRPPALRSLIQVALGSPDFRVAAEQAITARSWYQADEEEIRDIFARAITRVLTGQTDAATALAEAQDQISQEMGRRRAGEL